MNTDDPLFDFYPLTPLAVDRNNLTIAIVAALMNKLDIIYADPSTGRIDLRYNNRRYFLQLRLRK